MYNQTETQSEASGGMVSPSLKAQFESPFDMAASDRKDLTLSQDPASRETPIGSVVLFGVPIICLYIEGKERLCLAQISNTLLRDFSYNEIHNRRVALGITCMQCTPVQLEILRRTGAMPVSSRRCGLITKREAERLVRSFLEDVPPPKLPENFSFKVHHKCGWGCQGLFIPSRYNSSRAKCIKCLYCSTFYSPNKFIFHFHKAPSSSYRHPDAANFNSWRRHLYISDPNPSESLIHTWEDVKAMFNGGCRKRMSISNTKPSVSQSPSKDIVSNYTSSVALPNSAVPTYSSFQGNPLYQTEISDRTHPAFPTGVPQPRSNVSSYGDMLRSLSMHYSPWWKSLYFPRPQLPSPSPYSHLPTHFSNLNYDSPIQCPSIENIYTDKVFGQSGRKSPLKKCLDGKTPCYSQTQSEMSKEQGKGISPNVSSTTDAEIYSDFDDLIDIDTCDVVNINDDNNVLISENMSASKDPASPITTQTSSTGDSESNENRASTKEDKSQEVVSDNIDCSFDFCDCLL